MKIFSWILVFCVLLVAGYYIWGYTGKEYSSLHTTTVPIIIVSDSVDKGKGNLVAIQPFLKASDYCDQQHFRDALVVYFRKAQAAGLLHPNTIAVLPENIGSWLVFANEKTRVYEADSMRQAVSTIVNSNIFVFIRNLLVTSADDKIKHAFVYMKAASMARIYAAVFSSLAKEFKVTIAAGSIILPDPSVDIKGRIRIKKGQLYYSAFLFDPDGKIQGQPLLKILPEYNGGEAGSAADSHLSIAAHIPSGVVIITADENFSITSIHTFRPLRNVKAAIYLNGKDKIWDASWKSQNGFAIPLSAISSHEDTSFLPTSIYYNQVSSQIMPTGSTTQLRVHNGFSGSLWEISYKNRLSLYFPVYMILDRDPVKQRGIIVNTWLQ